MTAPGNFIEDVRHVPYTAALSGRLCTVDLGTGSEGGGSGEQAWNGEGRGVARLCQEGKEQGGRGTGPARSPCWLPRSGSTAVARDVGSFEGTVCWWICSLAHSHGWTDGWNYLSRSCLHPFRTNSGLKQAGGSCLTTWKPAMAGQRWWTSVSCGHKGLLWCLPVLPKFWDETGARSLGTAVYLGLSCTGFLPRCLGARLAAPFLLQAQVSLQFMRMFGPWASICAD